LKYPVVHVDIEQLGVEHPDTLLTLMSLGNVSLGQGKLEDALATYQDV
jgi:hypothetical protein